MHSYLLNFMALKGKGFDNDNAKRKQEKEQRKLRIAQDKERARVWAENRRLRRVPLVVAHEVTELRAHEVTELRTEGSTSARTTQPSQQSLQQGITDPLAILETLEKRRQLLLREAGEIQSAIQVIRRTLSYESHIQEPTGRRTSRG